MTVKIRKKTKREMKGDIKKVKEFGKKVFNAVKPKNKKIKKY